MMRAGRRFLCELPLEFGGLVMPRRLIRALSRGHVGSGVSAAAVAPLVDPGGDISVGLGAGGVVRGELARWFWRGPWRKLSGGVLDSVAGVEDHPGHVAAPGRRRLC